MAHISFFKNSSLKSAPPSNVACDLMRGHVEFGLNPVPVRRMHVFVRVFIFILKFGLLFAQEVYIYAHKLPSMETIVVFGGAADVCY